MWRNSQLKSHYNTHISYLFHEKVVRLDEVINGTFLQRTLMIDASNELEIVQTINKSRIHIFEKIQKVIRYMFGRLQNQPYSDDHHEVGVNVIPTNPTTEPTLVEHPKKKLSKYKKSKNTAQKTQKNQKKISLINVLNFWFYCCLLAGTAHCW